MLIKMKSWLAWRIPCLLLMASFLILQPAQEERPAPMPVTSKSQSCLAGRFPLAENQPLRILGLGDSLTVGIGDEKGNGGYLGILQAKLKEMKCPSDLVNFSKKGYRTDQLLESLAESEVIAQIQQAHVISLTIGANDLLSLAKKKSFRMTKSAIQAAATRYAQDIQASLEEIRRLNEEALIYLIGFYNPLSKRLPMDKIDQVVTDWNAIGAYYTAQLDGAYFIPVTDLLHDDIERYLADDHFHLNYLGYKKIAERLYEHLLKEGESL